MCSVQKSLPLFICSGLPRYDCVPAVVHALPAAVRGPLPPRRLERHPRHLQHHRPFQDTPRVCALTAERNLLLCL